METLTDLSANNVKRLNRAANFERFSNIARNAQERIDALTAQAIDTDTLATELDALAKRVPAGIMSRSAFGSPGGYLVGPLLTGIAINLQTELRFKEEQRLEALAMAREELTAMTRALEELESESA
jgi:hypothetical protein